MTGGLVAAQLYAIGAREPWLYAMVAAAFALVGAGASARPAARAARVDPIVSLTRT